MDSRQRRTLTEMLDTVRVNRTRAYHWVYARYGPDGEAFMAIFQWPADARSCFFDLRRDADRSRILEGMVWFLDEEFVFRAADPRDPELLYGFRRNLIDQGFRDAHTWIREGRYRLIQAAGDERDPTSWFEDPARAERVAAELRALSGSGAPAAAPAGGPPSDGALDALDLLDGLDGLDALDDLDL